MFTIILSIVIKIFQLNLHHLCELLRKYGLSKLYLIHTHQKRGEYNFNPFGASF